MTGERDGKITDPAQPAVKAAAASRAKCPTCNRPNEAAFAPFCSRRCADVDLSRWMTGSYAIAGTPTDDEDAES